MSLVGVNGSGMPDYEDRNLAYEAAYDAAYNKKQDELLFDTSSNPSEFLEEWFVNSEQCNDEFLDDDGYFVHSALVTARKFASDFLNTKNISLVDEGLREVYYPSFKEWIDYEVSKEMAGV